MRKFLLAALLMGIAVAVDAANGTLCLTFDDIYFSSWLQNLPLFQKYNARENSVLVLYAHDITQQMQPQNHITIDQLTILLEHARKLGMAIRGMNEL